MNRIALYHNSHEAEYRSPFGAVACDSEVRLSLDVSGLPPDCVCSLRVWFREVGETLIPMSPDGDEPDFQEYANPERPFFRRYTGVYTAPETAGLAWYYFIVTCSGITRYYGNNDRNQGGEGREAFSPPPSYQLTVYEESPS
ncbi:MAG: hypothetical protein LBS32_07965, partial [Clostridiales Family XIII bacterium]|nr:hypothetical protein [Clostridiales Family XIII bacterium]